MVCNLAYYNTPQLVVFHIILYHLFDVLEENTLIPLIVES